VGVLPGTAGAARAEADVSVGVFYDTLSPHGEWVEVRGVGRVWRPSRTIVGADFEPYASGGHWVYTDYGWSFESERDWGWAPFHYGRWYDDPSYGWLWVPGTVWGPAWVDWRFGGGYVGWAPLAPVGVTVIVAPAPRRWCFVQTANFTQRRVWDYRVPRERAPAVLASTRVIRNDVTFRGARWNAGPSARRIAVAGGRPVTAVQARGSTVGASRGWPRRAPRAPRG
jgi:hypothetical protein